MPNGFQLFHPGGVTLKTDLTDRYTRLLGVVNIPIFSNIDPTNPPPGSRPLNSDESAVWTYLTENNASLRSGTVTHPDFAKGDIFVMPVCRYRMNVSKTAAVPLGPYGTAPNFNVAPDISIASDKLSFTWSYVHPFLWMELSDPDGFPLSWSHSGVKLYYGIF
jgi:hypothetical protein